MCTMPPKSNVNARIFTPSLTHLARTLNPQIEDSPSPAPTTKKKKTRHQRHDRFGKRMRYLAAGLPPPPRYRKSRRQPNFLSQNDLAAGGEQHQNWQHNTLETQVKVKEEVEEGEDENDDDEDCSRPQTPLSAQPSAATHQSTTNTWQRRLHYQHPRAWTSVSGIGCGGDWGKAIGSSYGGLTYTEPRPITGDEMVADCVVERAYKREDWT